MVAGLALSALLIIGCGSGGGGETTDPNAQSKPTWTETATPNPKANPEVGPSKQAALRVSLAVYAKSFGPTEHSYKNQCRGPNDNLSWDCNIIGKRCAANVIVTFNSPEDSVGHPYRITDDCYPSMDGFYPFY